MSTLTPALSKKIGAEALGTFVLVFGGCGTAAFAGKVVGGTMGIALAFGLTVVVMAFAVGHISGGHFNPAVTIGAAAGKRIPWSDVPAYIASQLVGGLIAGLFLWIIGRGSSSSFTLEGASNGYGAHSPGGFDLLSCLLAEAILTAIFLFVILGTTDVRAPKGFAPLAIGLTLTLIHLVCIPITNTSVNPARSLAMVPFAGTSWPAAQLWLFVVAPVIGALIAGLSYKALLDDPSVSGELELAMEA